MRDSDVRAAVRKHLDALHAGDSSTRIVEEMGVWAGTVRVDIAVINGELSGYELKSDRDTLERLPTQADIYSRVFDQVTLVVGRRHAEKAVAIVPGWWTVMHAVSGGDEIVSLQTVRGGCRNPSPDPYLIAGLLWKEEAIEVLDELGLARGWRGTRLRLLHERLASELPFYVLSEKVRSALKRRQGWLGQHQVHQLHVPTHANPNPVLKALR